MDDHVTGHRKSADSFNPKSAEIRKRNQKRFRNGVPKSAQTNKDKSDSKYTKTNFYIFALL